MFLSIEIKTCILYINIKEKCFKVCFICTFKKRKKANEFGKINKTKKTDSYK